MAASDQGESQSDEAYHEIERDCRPGVETDCVHEDRKPKLAAAQADKTTKAADWYAPAKRPTEEGTTNHSVHFIETRGPAGSTYILPLA
jgi:hypothetical protein